MLTKKLEAAALRLDLKSRARLASLLIDSLEYLSPEEIEALWLEEAVRRMNALDAGLTNTIPLAQVMNRLRRRHSAEITRRAGDGISNLSLSRPR